VQVPVANDRTPLPVDQRGTGIKSRSFAWPSVSFALVLATGVILEGAIADAKFRARLETLAADSLTRRPVEEIRAAWREIGAEVVASARTVERGAQELAEQMPGAVSFEAKVAAGAGPPAEGTGSDFPVAEASRVPLPGAAPATAALAHGSVAHDPEAGAARPTLPVVSLPPSTPMQVQVQVPMASPRSAEVPATSLTATAVVAPPTTQTAAPVTAKPAVVLPPAIAPESRAPVAVPSFSLQVSLALEIVGAAPEIPKRPTRDASVAGPTKGPPPGRRSTRKANPAAARSPPEATGKAASATPFGDLFGALENAAQMKEPPPFDRINKNSP
jgi:hypothetical protein